MNTGLVVLSVNWSGTLKDKWWLLESNEILIEIGSNGTNDRSWKRGVLPRQLSTVDSPILLFLSLFFAFFPFFFRRRGARSDPRYLWERPTVREAPAFHLQLDQPRQTIDRLSRVLRVRQAISVVSLFILNPRAIIRIPNQPDESTRRYPAKYIYIYICKVDR